MVNINGLHKSACQKNQESGTEDTPLEETETQKIEGRTSDDDFSRSKSLAVGTQIKKPQLAKSSFNLKDKTPTPNLP